MSKEQSSPILTIGIPTYNGEEYIKGCLESVLANAVGRSASVEVLVSDNDSTDHTADVVSEFKDAHPENNINYYKNEENVGYDRNVDLIFRRAKGRYVWLMGDDDEIQNNGVSELLDLISRQPDVSLFLVNFEQYSRSLDDFVAYIEVTYDGVCEDACHFLNNAKSRYGLCSSLIISKEAWLGEFDENTIGTNFVH